MSDPAADAVMLAMGAVAAAMLMWGLLIPVPAHAAPNPGQSVQEKFSSRQAVEDGMFAPLSSDAPMETTQGETFDAHLQCPAQDEFMRVSFSPTPDNDIHSIGVEVDRDLNGSKEYTALLPGPFAAVCNNGAVRCTPGTTRDCVGQRWRYQSGTLELEPIATEQLGGCYCFNNSCGAGLLGHNSRQVLGDLGTGIANAMQQEHPRLGVGSGEQLDATTMRYYGQASGCGSDARPEQYYRSPSQARAAGQAQGRNPDSLYYRMTHSDVANQNQEQAPCSVRRVITTDASDNPDVLSVAFNEYGHRASCGDACEDLHVGRQGIHYLSGSCFHQRDVAVVTIHRPERIASVILETVSFDDWMRIRIDGVIVYNGTDPGWTSPGPRCGENNCCRGTHHPGIDLTAYFNGAPAGRSVEIAVEVSGSELGHGIARFRVRSHTDTQCRITSESIQDNCGSLERNLSCTLRDETVDGVQTHQDYAATGLSPLPSSRTFTGPGCSTTVTRNWWEKDRVYTCEGESDGFDTSYSADRYQVIATSYDSETGQFRDRRQSESGAISQHDMRTPIVPRAPNDCQPMCKTRKPRGGPHMTAHGSSSDLNTSGPAWSYTYYECRDNRCPADDEEEIVATCDCRSNFMEAVTVMQTIRMFTQDAQCVAP